MCTGTKLPECSPGRDIDLHWEMDDSGTLISVDAASERVNACEESFVRVNCPLRLFAVTKMSTAPRTRDIGMS
ncbi:MAG: hypothetical protein ACKPKO_34025, partial [Candidatus Fonsibacter sp.]